MRKVKKIDPSIPLLKTKKLDSLLGLPIEGETKKELLDLKHKHGVDHLEWVRGLIRENLPALKAKLKGA